MIPKMRGSVQTIPLQSVKDITWQQLLAGSKLSTEELCARFKLPYSSDSGTIQAHTQFPLRVPEPYLQRIEVGNPNDPLLLQILPQAQEMQVQPGYSSDPLAENENNPIAGLVHKYKSRALVILSGGCAINCRYCFRRHFPYEDNQLGSAQWQTILHYLEQDKDINEVIFSGGDPLATPDKRIRGFIKDLEKIPHIKRLRIHSRLPIVIPQRITDEFISLLSESRLQAIMVVHANHGNEINDEVGNALSRLNHAGITTLNQSVLLKGVNDSADALIALSERLFEFNTLPYYLHLLDKVQGSSHFEVEDMVAKKLILELQANLPGYLVPKLVREEPNKPSKTLIDLRLD